MTDLPSVQLRVRGSIWLAVVEFGVVAGLFVADIRHHIYVSKTPYLFLLGVGVAAASRIALEGRRLCASAQLGKGCPLGSGGWGLYGSV